jgi:Cd2+/Zn2+-exporting ATPase
MNNHNHENCSCHAHHDHHCHCHESECGCTHEHVELNKRDLIIFVFTAIVFVLSVILKSQIVALMAIIVCGFKIFAGGIKSLARLKFDENTLILIAVIATVIMKEYTEGYLITLLFGIGQFLEEYSIGKSRQKIESLISLTDDKAHDKMGNEIDPKSIKIGDEILVRPGDKLCVDTKIINGTSSFDTSSLTGESMPKDASVGDIILSGTINLTNSVICEAISTYHNSTASKIKEYVNNASSKKADTEKFITSFSKIYTPTVIITAVFIAILFPLVGIAGITEAIRRALTFMIASCPCALVISIPLAYYAAIGAASKKGILIKGSKFINVLSKADAIAFDKTGTLTMGELSVADIICEEGTDRETALSYASALEIHSSHPVARAICKSYNNATYPAENVHEVFGKGILGTVNGNKVAIGNTAFCKEQNLGGASDIGINLYINGQKCAVFKLTDTVRPEAKNAFELIRKNGIKTICILSGDTNTEAEKLKNLLGADIAKGSLLPTEKASEIDKMKNSGKTIIFAGDGVNDAPSLAKSDVSISVLSESAIALEAGDLTMISDSLMAIPYVIKTAKHTMRVIYTNIWFSLLVKLIVLLLATIGIAPIWLALFADVGVLILTVLNSLSVVKA